MPLTHCIIWQLGSGNALHYSHPASPVAKCKIVTLPWDRIIVPHTSCSLSHTDGPLVSISLLTPVCCSLFKTCLWLLDKGTYISVILYFIQLCLHWLESKCWIYPVVWKLAENYHDNSIPAKYTLDLQDMPEDHQYLKFCLINNSHWSADWTQRSRLFICVETNSWWRVVSSIAFAVSWVSSGQFLSGSFISIRGHYLYLRWKCLLSSPSSCT